MTESLDHADFKRRLAAVLADLKDAGTGDGQAMYSLGSIASQICAGIKAGDWTQLKSIINEKDFRALLASFESQGKAYLANDDVQSAYAIQALAVSLVARTNPDPQVQEGGKLLDRLIDQAIDVYRHYIATRSKPN